MSSLRRFLRLSRTVWLGLVVLGWFCPELRAAEREVDVPGVSEPFLDLILSSSAAGIVAARKVNEGDFVKGGDVLVELDKRLEELEVERRKHIRETIEGDLKAVRHLYETTSSVSKEELDKKQLEFRVAVLEEQVAAEQLRQRILMAPAAGVVSEIRLDIGEACQAQQPFIRLVDTRQCYFVADVEARVAASLKLDQPVSIQIDTGERVETLVAKIIYLAPVVDPASGLRRVKALFDNSKGLIRPGLAGTMRFKRYAD